MKFSITKILFAVIAFHNFGMAQVSDADTVFDMVQEHFRRSVVNEIRNQLITKHRYHTIDETISTRRGTKSGPNIAFYLSSYDGTVELRGRAVNFECLASHEVRRVPFAKQDSDVVILQELVNDSQLILKSNFRCMRLN